MFATTPRRRTHFRNENALSAKKLAAFSPLTDDVQKPGVASVGRRRALGDLTNRHKSISGKRLNLQTPRKRKVAAKNINSQLVPEDKSVDGDIEHVYGNSTPAPYDGGIDTLGISRCLLPKGQLPHLCPPPLSNLHWPISLSLEPIDDMDFTVDLSSPQTRCDNLGSSDLELQFDDLELDDILFNDDV